VKVHEKEARALLARTDKAASPVGAAGKLAGVAT
jgi:hypothetical protein